MNLNNYISEFNNLRITYNLYPVNMFFFWLSVSDLDTDDIDLIWDITPNPKFYTSYGICKLVDMIDYCVNDNYASWIKYDDQPQSKGYLNRHKHREYYKRNVSIMEYMDDEFIKRCLHEYK